MSEAVPVAILFGILVLAYVGMLVGWRRRGRRHDIEPLTPVGEQVATLQGEGRYFGTVMSDSWLDRVVAQGLGNRSDCALVVGAQGLDVRRRRLESFRIARGALLGARRERGLAGKVIPPDGMLVVTWRHGDHVLDSGFRLNDGDHDPWILAIDKLVKEHTP